MSEPKFIQELIDELSKSESSDEILEQFNLLAKGKITLEEYISFISDYMIKLQEKQGYSFSESEKTLLRLKIFEEIHLLATKISGKKQ